MNKFIFALLVSVGILTAPSIVLAADKDVVVVEKKEAVVVEKPLKHKYKVVHVDQRTHFHKVKHHRFHRQYKNPI